jgi:hypothetical protein
MAYYDVFNGDADGICALHQLRLADPLDSTLVTGLKREIALLDRVPARDGDVVNVLDISLDRNREALQRLLDRGVVVRYFDHHYPGAIPEHPNLEVMVDTSGHACTSALIDRHLGGRFRAWAVVGAFGDALPSVALELAASMRPDALAELRELGETLNYNAYGESPEDAILPPLDLYRLVHAYENPFFLLRDEIVVGTISSRRKQDLARALATRALCSEPSFDAFILPDEGWSRRVSGTFANHLALGDPSRAHVVLTPVGDAYLVSVRTPEGGAPTAVDLCRQYPGGGGRACAAGIDRLPRDRLAEFLETLRSPAGPRAFR